MEDVDALVRAWCDRDLAFAFLPQDKSAIDVTRGARALVVESALGPSPRTELFPACAVLGRLLADAGASASLASGVIETLREAVPGLGADAARGAQAALAEGFAAVRAERARDDAARRWDFPRCAVPLENATIAIAAGYPDDDEDALAAWSSRVASAVARSGYRRAIVAGAEKPRLVLVDALELAGVKVRTTAPPAPVGRK
jgi:hypothetical protein